MSILEAIGLFVVCAGLFSLITLFFGGMCCVIFEASDEDSWIWCLVVGAIVYGGTMVFCCH